MHTENVKLAIQITGKCTELWFLYCREVSILLDLDSGSMMCLYCYKNYEITGTITTNKISGCYSTTFVLSLDMTTILKLNLHPPSIEIKCSYT
jgi:hypothetical protein